MARDKLSREMLIGLDCVRERRSLEAVYCLEKFENTTDLFKHHSDE